MLILIKENCLLLFRILPYNTILKLLEIHIVLIIQIVLVILIELVLLLLINTISVHGFLFLGLSYEYNYQMKTTTTSSPTDFADQSIMAVRAKATIGVIAPCEYVLTVRHRQNTNISEFKEIHIQ